MGGTSVSPIFSGFRAAPGQRQPPAKPSPISVRDAIAWKKCAKQQAVQSQQICIFPTCLIRNSSPLNNLCLCNIICPTCALSCISLEPQSCTGGAFWGHPAWNSTCDPEQWI